MSIHQKSTEPVITISSQSETEPSSDKLRSTIQELIQNFKKGNPYYYLNKNCCTVIKILKDFERAYLDPCNKNKKNDIKEVCQQELNKYFKYINYQRFIKKLETNEKISEFTQEAVQSLDLKPLTPLSYTEKNSFPSPTTTQEQSYKLPKAKL